MLYLTFSHFILKQIHQENPKIYLFICSRTKILKRNKEERIFVDQEKLQEKQLAAM